jgi:tungstate transport system ATP-binding protein
MLYKLENLVRIHGNRTVLNIQGLEIHPNAIYTLIGPNGAGKTSLLQILAFLDKPSSGRINFNGQKVTFNEKHLHCLRRQVVLLDQSPILFTGTVYRNVEFGLKVRKIPGELRKQRIEEMLELVGMEKFADYDTQGLSGGEVKRVALARALAVRPDVLLCDEPTANVDGENQEIILNILRRINREEKTSIIFSTHYLSQGQRLADHTLLLQNGSLSDLVNENVFRVTLSHQSADETLCRLTEQLILKLPTERVPTGISAAKLHIDPEKIVLDPGKKDLDYGNYLNGHILDLSQENGTVRVGIDVGVRLTFAFSTERYNRIQLRLGERRELFIPYDGIVCTKGQS